MRISAVVPNYNHARYLGASLSALAAQTHPAHEIIVVDDASTDNSVEVVQEHARIYPAISLIRNRKNMGVNASVYAGIKASTGDYIACPGADDMVLPRLFERAVAAFTAYPQAGLFSARAHIIDAEGRMKPYDTPLISPTPCFLPPEKYLETYRRHNNWILTYTAVVRRDAAIAVDLFNPANGLGPLADAVGHREIAMHYGSLFHPWHLACWRKVEGGYGYEFGQDADRVLSAWRAVEGRISSPSEAEFFRLWKRRIALLYLYYLGRRVPFPLAEVRRFVAEIPSTGLTERLILRLLPGLGRLPLKVYLRANYMMDRARSRYRRWWRP